MTRTQRILLIVLGVLLVLVIFNYLVYAPAQAEYQSLIAQRDERQKERDRLRNIAQRREALETEYDQLQASIPALEAKLPAEKDVPVLLVQLEQLAGSLRVDLSTISIGAIQRGQAQGGAATADVGTIPLGLSVTATYQQLIELLAQLQDFPRLVAVKNMTIGPAELPKLNVQLNAETYVLAREGAR